MGTVTLKLDIKWADVTGYKLETIFEDNWA
jgi:hypothetical protein